MRPLLVTSALPYANGPIHLGHMVEYVQTDIWVRYWRLRGRKVVFVCADDTHGTPIMLRAQAEGIEPEELIRRIWHEHRRDFAGFKISFDNYYTTHSPENEALAREIYGELRRGGHIAERNVQQAYCERCRIFLPDRYIRGTCATCGALDQYGDSCEACSTTYRPEDLVSPRCATCSSPPVWRESLHLFFRLAGFADRLREWVNSDSVQPEVAHKLDEWFDTGLKDWDISRDAPYFGFEVPDHPGKYFYVWLDAPVGYMASTLNWCHRTGEDFDRYWRDESADVVHFIGKDIVYFHALFWPALLMGSGFRRPTRLVVHGFLTVNGEKMSKTRGTFIRVEDYLRHLDPQYLRWYYATKLSGRIDDLDLSFDDFTRRVNSDLVHKLANVPSRTLAILHRYCGGRLGEPDEAGRALVESVRARRAEVAGLYEGLDFAQVTRLVVEMASTINAYLTDARPWDVAPQEARRAADVCTGALNAFAVLSSYVQPILPDFSERVAQILGVPAMSWDDPAGMLENRSVGVYEHLVQRVGQADVAHLTAASSGPA